MTLRQVVDRFRRREGALMLYMVAVQITSQIAAPFFTPFMLEKLQYSYGLYVAMLATSYLARSAVLFFWGGMSGNTER
ncbi:MAG: hypothetical protein IPK83_21570 [Planctomycetes bacterium]|nr:hypothetical protein [Planctomycetota bacterium]